ncbi:unnamed protein product [Urochloa humidicola]
MPLRKRGRDERDGPHQRQEEQRRRLYLIFDDWPWGYTIRELDLSPPPAAGSRSPHLRRPAEPQQQLLLSPPPPPILCLEAPRGSPWNFAAAGTRIVSTHGRNQVSVPDGFLPIVDVRSRGVTFGPWEGYPHLPIYIPIGDDEIFALDTSTSFRSLSLEPLWPPRLESTSNCEWSWRYLPEPPFSRADVTSHAVGPDGRTILVTTAAAAGAATFAFDTAAAEPVWYERRHGGEWTLMPFAGRAHFVDDLNAFVGLSKDHDSFGRLCSVGLVDLPYSCSLGKEKLFSEDPDERHVGATLVYMGGTEFCLVQCVSIGDTRGTADDADQEQLQVQEVVDHIREVLDALDHGRPLPELVEGITAERKERKDVQYIYRLMTFSVGYDSDGRLTTGESCRLQCYEVPEQVTEDFFYHDPVAFWL